VSLSTLGSLAGLFLGLGGISIYQNERYLNMVVIGVIHSFLGGCKECCGKRNPYNLEK
jgi:hypothetical protein